MAESRKRKISDSDPPAGACSEDEVPKRSRKDLIPAAPTSEEKAPGADTWGPWGQCAPPDILLKIFEELLWGRGSDRVTSGRGVLKLLGVSRVCRLWREVSTHPALWHRIKLSNPEDWLGIYIHDPRGKEALKSLCQNKLGRTQNLRLEGWESLVDSDIKMVVKGCRNLHTLQLWHCTALTSRTLDIIADGLPLLQHLDMGSTPVRMNRKRLIRKCSLLHLTTKLGGQLKSLNLSRSVFSSKLSTDPTALAEALSKCCQLEELQLKKCHGKFKLRKIDSVFLLDIEMLQAGCPKLRVLDLSHSMVQLPDLNAENEKLSPGFQNLEEYRSCDKTKETLLRVLRGASNLRTLNLKWAKLRELGTLPATALEMIVLPKRSPSPSLIQQISQWEKTLQYVDMSGVSDGYHGYPTMKLSDILRKLLKPGRFHNLRKFDISNTWLTMTGLRTILKYCPGLEWINLNLCDSLGDERSEMVGYVDMCTGVELERLKCKVLHGCCNRPLLCKYCRGEKRTTPQSCRCNADESSESELESSDEHSDFDEYEGGGFYDSSDYEECVLL